MAMEIKVAKCDATFSIDETKVPAHIHDRIVRYGWTQFLGDSLSQFSLEGSKSTTKATVEEMRARVEDTIARLYSGEWRSTRAVDTVGKMAYNLALKKVCNVWMKANPGKDLKAYDRKSADAQALVESDPAFTAQAEALIELTSGE